MLPKRLLGVDACRAGWIGAHRDGDRIWLKSYGDCSEIIQSDNEIIVIDVPIGVTSAGPRLADVEARKMLGTRSCCVFPAPYRSMLGAASHSEASKIRGEVDGKGMSIQAYCIMPKIAEVDSGMTPALQRRIFEGHPEVSFAMLRGGVPIEYPKKSRVGREERLTAIRRAFPSVTESVISKRPKGVGADDILDAFAMLWTAGRIASNTALQLPTEDQYDEKGLLIRITA